MKLVRCIEGSIFDVIVDIRKESSTYGEHLTVELSDKNKCQLFVYKGFVHSFVVLNETVVIAYKVDYYATNHGSDIKWDDKKLAIDWKIRAKDILLSEKDKNLCKFKELSIS